MSACAARFRRLVDRAFVRGISARQRRDLRAHLAVCSECRERWDRLAAVERNLGGPALTGDTIDDISEAVVPRSRTRRPLVWATASGVVAAAGILMTLMWNRDVGNETLTPRGGGIQGSTRTPGLRLFCISGSSDHVVSAVAMGSTGSPSELRCTMDSDLQLAYSTPDLEGLTMVAFGRIQTSTLAYAPPGGEGDAMMLRADRIDEVVEWSTRLAVNHRPGRYVVIARFFDHRVSVADAIAGRVAPVAELQARLEVLPQGAVVDAP